MWNTLCLAFVIKHVTGVALSILRVANESLRDEAILRTCDNVEVLLVFAEIVTLKL
jgi:hypothetical protein